MMAKPLAGSQLSCFIHLIGRRLKLNFAARVEFCGKRCKNVWKEMWKCSSKNAKNKEINYSRSHIYWEKSLISTGYVRADEENEIPLVTTVSEVRWGEVTTNNSSVQSGLLLNIFCSFEYMLLWIMFICFELCQVWQNRVFWGQLKEVVSLSPTVPSWSPVYKSSI